MFYTFLSFAASAGEFILAAVVKLPKLWAPWFLFCVFAASAAYGQSPAIVSTDTHGNPNGLTVVYSRPMAGASSSNLSNYTLTNAAGSAVSVTNAALAPDLVTVQLGLGTSLQLGGNYTLVARNVSATNGSLINPNPTLAGLVFGGSVTYLFDDGLVPSGTILRRGPDSAGNQTNPGLGVTNAGGFGNSGCLVLTVPATAQTFGQWLITNDLAKGATVTNLSVAFKLYVGHGNNYWSLPNSGGNGMVFHWGPGMLDQYTGGASSWGRGLDVTFRTVNSGGNQSYGINIFYGGASGPGQNAPIATSSYIGYFQTNGAADSFSEAVDVSLSVSNGLLSLKVTGTNGVSTNVYSNLAISGFVPPPMGGTNLGFTATDGSGAHEDCWLDNVDFTINGSHIPGSLGVGPVAFTLQPASQTVPANVRATFSASVSGAPPFNFQWRSNAVPIPGATAATYTTPSATAAMNGAAYAVAVSNLFSGVISTNATLTVLTSPVVISSQPASQVVPVGWTAMLTVAVDPASIRPLSYQWLQLANSTAYSIPGATNAFYITPSLTLSDSGKQFFVAVSNSFSGVFSSNAIVTVAQYPVVITGQPLSQTLPLRAAASFTVSLDPSSTGPLCYLWRQISSGGVINAVPGATNATYTTPPLEAADSGTQYYVVVRGAVNAATSSVATVAVSSPPVLAPPAVAADGANLSLTWANGGSLLSATNLVGPWTRVAGATNSPFTLPIEPATPQQFFRVQQFGAPVPLQDYTPYVNVVQNANGQNGFHNTALLRYPLGRIGLWSIDPGEFADCVTRGLRLYPCIDTIVNRGTADWRNTISGDPSRVTIGYQTSVPALGSAVDLTVTPHVSIFRYHLASASLFQAVAMMVNDLSIDTYNWNNNTFTVIDGQTIQATLNGGSKTIYYYIRFNVPSVGQGTINGSAVTDGAGSISGSNIGGYFKFNTSEVTAAVAISHTSMAQAQAYFNAEFSTMDFDVAAAALRNAWAARLGRVEAQGPTLAMRQLYTALYTVYVNTIDASDNPYYTSYKPLLTIASSDYWQAVGSYLRCDWDMSRGVYQLMALIDPEVFTHLINTYQAQYDRDQPRFWCNWDPFSASGFSVTMFLPDFVMLAWQHGISGIDYTRLKNSLTNYYQHCYPPQFFSLGYIPSDGGDPNGNPASHTLDYATPMQGMALLGRTLGDSATYNYYYQFRTNYMSLYDAANQQFRTKMTSGAWGTLGADLFEGNGVSYRFCAPQDPYGLLALYGPGNAVSMIDSYMRSQADFNDYQLIYEYLPIFADRADESQMLVRAYHIPKFNTLIMSEGFWPASRGCYYTDNAGPLACGLLGLYYIPTAGAAWLLNTPSFDRVTVHGKTDLTIQTLGNSPTNNYISSLQLNGAPYPSYVISGKTLVAANQTLTLSLTNAPARLGSLYLSSADGEVLAASTDGNAYLDFSIDSIAASCSAQVYSASVPASITLDGASFTSWTYDPTTKLATLSGMTKGSYRVTAGN